ncbi:MULTISPECIES: hypothetical protein [unclassified Prochlorococcus]|uniref:hypothetical protein n=1 Tax=unclassified Prochlorococcus TaxID=2627481 RepID=UPI00097CC37D|nr:MULTISPECIES: hypothetical protein [unclassified Prochlorococcus]AQL29784.1 hypothetical protein BSR22_00690 [Prochlorococcus sp. RS50]AQL31585.1 hypothetical protein BS620_00785 [Prochlorococcus sp. RS01]AQL34537.1 hypothetical protein BS621_07105 [Prochlorococcus sp. RS04]
MNNYIFTVVVSLHNMKSELADFIQWFKDEQENIKNIFYIIKDTGYNFETLKKIKNYKNILIISEPDNSLYEAWNRVLPLVKTNYVMFHGISDRISHVPINLQNYLKISTSDVIYFDFIGNSNKIYKLKNVNQKFALQKFPINLKFCFSCSLIKKESLLKNPFNCNYEYKILGDLDWIIRNKKNLEFRYYATLPFLIFDTSGCSKNYKFFNVRLKEYLNIINSNNYSFIHYVVYFLGTFIKTIIFKSL